MGSRFKDRVVLITGGASGIGAATAELFAEEGAKLFLCDLNEALGATMVEKLGAERTGFRRCDVGDREDVEAMVAECVKRFGRVNVLFNNAGIGGGLGATPEVAPETWDRVIAVNLNSVFYACRAVIPLMRRQGGGAIVNTASICGMAGDFGMTVYNATKAAVVNYTRCMALDHVRENIRVNALCPGLIATPLTAQISEAQELEADWRRRIPMGRLGTAREMANVVAFLASDEASYVTGCIVPADGGITAHTGQPDMLHSALAT